MTTQYASIDWLYRLRVKALRREALKRARRAFTREG